MQGFLFFADISEPNAANEWIAKACKGMSGLADETNPNWVMKLYPGEDHTRTDTPLDDLLLDEDVVHVIKTNHADLLKDGRLFDDDETLRMFFGPQRDANLIKALFN